MCHFASDFHFDPPQLSSFTLWIPFCPCEAVADLPLLLGTLQWSVLRPTLSPASCCPVKKNQALASLLARNDRWAAGGQQGSLGEIKPFSGGGNSSLGQKEQKSERVHWNGPGSISSPWVSCCIQRYPWPHSLWSLGSPKHPWGGAVCLQIEQDLVYQKTSLMLPLPAHDGSQAAQNLRWHFGTRLVPICQLAFLFPLS